MRKLSEYKVNTLVLVSLYFIFSFFSAGYSSGTVVSTEFSDILLSASVNGTEGDRYSENLYQDQYASYPLGSPWDSSSDSGESEEKNENEGFDKKLDRHPGLDLFRLEPVVILSEYTAVHFEQTLLNRSKVSRIILFHCWRSFLV